MSEPDVFSAAVRAREAGEAAVLATVVRTQGSVPRHAGAKMLIFPDGRIVGTIGGGEMESRVIDSVADLIAKGDPKLITVNLADPTRGDAGVCGGQVEIFLEPIMPDPTILVIGCGHVGQALADLAHWLGYRVLVTDDRADLCNAETIPNADGYYPIQASEIATTIPIHARTYIAAVTRGVPLDVAMLPGLLHSKAAYIGVMGSRRRWATAAKQLKEAGITAEEMARVYAPIGLEIEAETPRQIAVSIMGQVIAHQRGAALQSTQPPG